MKRSLVFDGRPTRRLSRDISAPFIFMMSRFILRIFDVPRY